MYPYGENLKVTVLPVVVTMSPQSTTYSGATTSGVAQTLTVASATGFNVGNTVSIGGVTATVTSASGTSLGVSAFSGPITASGIITVVETALNNVTLYFNGSQIGTQVTCSTANSNLSWNGTTGTCTVNFQLGSQMIATAGQSSTIQVRADLGVW